MSVKEGDFYKNSSDNRIYIVSTGSGANKSNNNVPTVAFKQVLNANDSDFDVANPSIGRKAYFRSEDSFLDKYRKVEWAGTPPPPPPPPAVGWANVTTPQSDDYEDDDYNENDDY